MAQYTNEELVNAVLDAVQLGREFAKRPGSVEEILSEAFKSDEFRDLLQRHLKPETDARSE